MEFDPQHEPDLSNPQESAGRQFESGRARSSISRSIYFGCFPLGLDSGGQQRRGRYEKSVPLAVFLHGFLDGFPKDRFSVVRQ